MSRIDEGLYDLKQFKEDTEEQWFPTGIWEKKIFKKCPRANTLKIFNADFNYYREKDYRVT
jgi:hypothetical protein